MKKLGDYTRLVVAVTLHSVENKEGIRVCHINPDLKDILQSFLTTEQSLLFVRVYDENRVQYGRFNALLNHCNKEGYNDPSKVPSLDYVINCILKVGLLEFGTKPE